MSIIVSSNINNKFWNTTHHGFVDSVVKNIGEHRFLLMFMDDGTGFNLNGLPSKVETSVIDNTLITHSKHANLKSTFGFENYACLESGEFVNFIDFDDDDILILCDWDVVMQRGFTEKELETFNNLGPTEFGVCKDHYHKTRNTRIYSKGNLLHGYFRMAKIYDDISEDWVIYQAGVQAARISAWKKLYEHWKELAPRFYELHREHFASQGLFNYIIHKFNMVKELPPTFHLSNHSGGNSKNPKHWWPGIHAELRPGIPMDLRYKHCPSEECEKILFDQPHFVYVNERHPKGEHEKILFNHHHWKHSPGF